MILRMDLGQFLMKMARYKSTTTWVTESKRTNGETFTATIKTAIEWLLVPINLSQNLTNKDMKLLLDRMDRLSDMTKKGMK